MGEPLTHLMKLAETLRGDVFARWMKRAQKAALIAWRDRKIMPGLAARFTREGASFYRFSPTPNRYAKSKGNLPEYVKTGRLRDLMRTRMTRSKHGADVVTSIRFGGGPLNFLTAIGGVVTTRKDKVTGTELVNAYSYPRRTKAGATVTISVASYGRRYSRVRTTLIRSGISYAAQFGDLSRDREWIRVRSLVEFRRILRGAAFDKNGVLKSTVLEPLDGVGS